MLREPNPLSDGFDAWTAWFDNLKACHARLRDEAERLEASRPSKGARRRGAELGRHEAEPVLIVALFLGAR